MRKKLLPLLLTTALTLSAAGCTAAAGTGQTEQKPAILVVSFGTSYNESRDKTIGAIEQAIQAAYPEHDVRRAFTSQTIIDKLKKRDGLEIDNVEEALDRLAADGVKNLVVQPTHVMSGFEYDDLAAAVESYRDKFDKIALGAPLLTSEEDFGKVVEIIAGDTASRAGGDTAVVLMGHGTEHEANAVYSDLQTAFKDAGYENYFIGTVEAEPSLDDILPLLREGGYSKVVLAPLMVVSGDHANNDMAGDAPDSWKSILEGEGLEVECLLQGLGQLEDIQQLYAAHAADAMEVLG